MPEERYTVKDFFLGSGIYADTFNSSPLRTGRSYLFVIRVLGFDPRINPRIWFWREMAGSSPAMTASSTLTR
jgi:hypothetical protein